MSPRLPRDSSIRDPDGHVPESQAREELMKGHDSSRLCRLSGPGREVGIATYDDEPVHCQILQLELVEDIGLVFFERVVAPKELASHEDRELEYSVESR